MAEDLSDGRQVTLEYGGKITVAPHRLRAYGANGVSITVNCRRDGVPAHVDLTVEEAASVHEVLEHLILRTA